MAIALPGTSLAKELSSAGHHGVMECAGREGNVLADQLLKARRSELLENYDAE